MQPPPTTTTLPPAPAFQEPSEHSQQLPPPFSYPSQQPQPQQWMIPPPQPQLPPQQTMWRSGGGGGADEVRTLWIGDLQSWMDEAYISGAFAATNELFVALFIYVLLVEMDLDSPPTAEEASEAQENRIFKMLVGYTRQNAKVRSLSNDKLDHFPEGISGIIVGHLGLKEEAVRMMKVSKDWNKWMKVYFQKNIRGMYFVNRDATLMKNIFSFLTFKERDKFEAVLQQVEESAPLTEGR